MNWLHKIICEFEFCFIVYISLSAWSQNIDSWVYLVIQRQFNCIPSFLSLLDNIKSNGSILKDNTILGWITTEPSYEKKLLLSVSSTLVLGGAIDITEAFILIFGVGPILSTMGANSVSALEILSTLCLTICSIVWNDLTFLV